MYKCLECGAIFDDNEMGNWTEPHGEEMTGCPCCGGAYEEAVMCDECGEWFFRDELTCGKYKVCRDCLEAFAKDSGTVIMFLEQNDLWDDFARWLDPND